MNYMKLAIIMIFSIFILSVPQYAKAIIVDIVATGHIYKVDIDLRDEFTVGETFTMTYSYETTTPDTYIGTYSPNRGNYLGAITASYVTIGDYNLAISGGSMFTRNKAIYGDMLDKYAANSSKWDDIFTGATVSGLFPYYSGIELGDLDGTALNDDSLPITAPNLLDFENREYNLSFASAIFSGYATGVQRVYGTVTSIEMVEVVVPEPSTLILIGLGLAGLILFKGKFTA